MKKFLTTVIVIIIAVSLGFGVFYLVKDNEVISLKTASLYKNINEKFELGLDLQDPNSYTTVEVFSTNDSVVKVTNGDIKIKGKSATGEFEAVGGGVAKVVFKTNNAKFRNVSCDIIVCDGSKDYPFRISTAEDLASIGTNPLYTLDKNYELTNDIDLGRLEGRWAPLSELKGSFNGNGHTIENLTVEGGDNIGLFKSIASTATVKNVKFANVKLVADANTNNMGTIAGINRGTISRIEVKSARILNNSQNSANVGGIVGYNVSSVVGETSNIAIIERTSAVVEMAGRTITDENDTTTVTGGITGFVGGIVGVNNGGTVKLSYTTGQATISNQISYFGGIIGKNTYLSIDNKDLGAYVRECYSIIELANEEANQNINATKVGYIIGQTIDSQQQDKFINVITGNYYEANLATIKGIAVAQGNGQPNENFDKYGAILSGKDEDTGKLQDLGTLISAEIGKYSYTFDSESNSLKKHLENSVTYLWNTDVWKIGSNGYPVLDYSDKSVTLVETTDDIESIVTNYEQFKKLIDENPNATMLIKGDIDFANVNWVPVDFDGKIYVDGDYVFKNLTVSGDYTYAGLFGTLGKNAVIDGLRIVNSNISGENAGVIAGLNQGMISNFAVDNCVVNAYICGGGVVGCNEGLIYGNDTETISQVKPKGSVANTTINGSLGELSLGGIAGRNSGTIKGVNQRIELENVTINRESNVGTAYLGGVVGYNTGSIKNIAAGNSTDNQDDNKAIIIKNEKTGVVLAGGIAGYTSGSITYASVVANITIGNKEGSYVGGIAGQVFFHTADYEIAYCSVSDSILHGHRTGGIAGCANVGYSCTLNAKNNLWVILWDDTASVDTSSNKAIISVCSVEGTSLNGTYTAGVVCELSKGVVKDIYTNVVMRGSNNAGIVYHINYNATSEEGGAVINVVSVANNERGTGYGASANDIHKQPILSKRTFGFVKNYHYQKSSKLKDNNQSGFGGNEGLNEAKMKKASNWKFLSSSIWNVNDGSVPTIKVDQFVSK